MVHTPVTFAHKIQWADLPSSVQNLMKRSVLDTIGVAAAGYQTQMGRITARYSKDHWQAGATGPKAQLMFDGASVSPAGAAFAGAFAIDAVDAHDGHSPVKGHAGSAVFPALCAFGGSVRLNGSQFMAAMAVGYEVGYRAGLAQHATLSDYHTSGAWTAIGVAAMGARLLELPPDATRHAMGIAEYHGPRSQMMRCIDHPTMVRDGVGWGAPSGVTAVYMAQAGFTGAPALTVEAAPEFWDGLGRDWEIERTHYKPYPVCRWAHPAIDAASDLRTQHGLNAANIASVEIKTFHNATRLAGQDPQTADDIAYGIAFPVAAMLVRGQVGLAELAPAVLDDAEICRISKATELTEDAGFNAAAEHGERWARVVLTLRDGQVLTSRDYRPKGDPDNPMSDAEISAKFHSFTVPLLGQARANQIEDLVGQLEQVHDIAPLLDLICAPV
ncbi:MmgE/PrpD family protein [Algirhabdus cladophorae]|uniref:MmgE/PrpD family protein n=1 Tax=Algirhabdus cladophorae TaxID=3377108 RepID=UPI003B84960D